MKESNEKYVDLGSSSGVRKHSKERVGGRSDRNPGNIQGKNFEIA